MHNDVGKWYRVLPVHPLETQILQVYIHNKKDLSELPEGYDAFKLHPYKVKAALRWLKTHNPLYAEIDIDFTEFDRWENENLENRVSITDLEGLDNSYVKVKMKVVKLVDSSIEDTPDESDVNSDTVSFFLYV